MCDYYTTTLVKGRNHREPRCVAERFWSKVIVGKAWECWEWTGTRNVRTGYGQLGSGGKGQKMLYTHRISWEMEYGPIPEGLELDHLCRNRACVNPHHLDLVPHQVNAVRGPGRQMVAHRENRCCRGHEMTEENASWRRNTKGEMIRQCLQCVRKNRRDYYYRHKQKGGELDT